MLNSQAVENLEGLDYEKAFNEHKVKFNSSIESFEEFYKDYENNKKIIQLLNAWLYLFRSLYECYDYDGVKKFSESDYGCPIRFSFYHEFGFNIGNKAEAYRSKYLFKALNVFLQNALLPGAKIHSLLSKFRWRFAKLIVINIPVKISAKRKSLIIELIMDYFEGYFNKTDTKKIEECIRNALPSIFFEDQVNALASNTLNVECAPWTFMEFSGFERILLLNRYVNVTGLQHGGSYFAFEPQYGRQFEENISDEFIGWGLSPNKNERQHRYKLGKQGLKKKTELNRLIWVEHAKLPIYHFLIWPSQIRQAFNRKAIEYIFREIDKVKMPFYSMPYPSHLMSNQYDGMRGIELGDSNGRGENVIVDGDIVIFDESGSSLIHHCIEQEIPFILVVSRDDISGFSRKKKEWFDVIRKAELAFFDDETGEMSKKINEAFQSRFEIPLELKEFHKSVFIDI